MLVQRELLGWKFRARLALKDTAKGATLAERAELTDDDSLLGKSLTSAIRSREEVIRTLRENATGRPGEGGDSK